MGVWFICLSVSLCLILIGLYTHWSLLIGGVLLPFLPLLSELARLRAARKRSGKDSSG
jgi:hypothetical protein